MRSVPWRWITGSTVPRLVDAALDDLDRLLDGLAHAIEHCGLRDAQADHAAAGVGHLKIALAAGPHQTAQRLGQLTQLGERRLPIGFLGDANLGHVVAYGDAPGEADLGVAQGPANVVANLVEPLLLHIGGIDLEQQIGAALEIEAEHEPALRPGGPGLDLRFGKEVRDRAEAHDQRRQDNPQRLPPREIQHRLDLSDQET